MERRFLPNECRLEKRQDGPSRIVGYAAVYYNGTEATQYQLWDDFIERIMPGAFDRAIREDDVRGLFNHNPDNLLGRTSSKTLVLESDGRGLRYTIAPPAGELTNRVLENLERGDLSGSSFAFNIVKQTMRQEGDTMIREINDVALFDVGPVTFPAYEATTAAARQAEIEDVKHAVEEWRQEQAEIARSLRMRQLELDRLEDME